MERELVDRYSRSYRVARASSAGDAIAKLRALKEAGDDVALVPGWQLERAPLSLETSIPGVFAAGDVRLGAMSRVASAVGEGSVAIRLVHELLEQRS